jgi:hypothetical protein
VAGVSLGVVLAVALGQVQESGAPDSTKDALSDGAHQESATKTDSEDTPIKNQQNGGKRGEFLAAPIPIVSPTIGAGLEWAVGYLFPFSRDDKISPHSAVGVGGLFTNNGSRGLAVGGKLYVKEDKYRFTLGGGGAKINADIYGVGCEAGDRGSYVPLTGTGVGIIGESLFRIGKVFYIGPRFQYRDLTLKLNREELNLPVTPPPSLTGVIEEIAPSLGQQRTVAIGPRFQWDTRGDKYYPQDGIFLDSGIDVFSKALGSKFTYQYYKIAVNKYMRVGKRQVIAVRGMGCAAEGDHVPIYDLCLFGNSNDLRGYPGGRYQDRRMFATQAEYRLTMPPIRVLGRFGIVAFGGVGGVGKNFSDINWEDLLPAGGGGLRFRLTNKDKVNFRVDYGVGKVGHTFTVGVGEAF